MVVFVAVANVAIYYELLKKRSHTPDSECTPDMIIQRPEQLELRSFVLIIIRIFVRSYQVYDGTKRIDALDIFRRSFIHFGQALINYAVYMDGSDGAQSALKPTEVHRMVDEYLNDFWIQITDRRSPTFTIPEVVLDSDEGTDDIIYVPPFSAVAYPEGSMGPDVPLKDFHVTS